MRFKINESILISTIIIFIYILYKLKRSRLTLVEANNNVKFMVYNDRKKLDSANRLSDLVDRMFFLKDHLVKNIDKYDGYQEYIKLLNDNFTRDRTSIYENAPDSDLTSFSVNKGEELAFCLKSKKTGNIHDINLLMYVAVHEMAHIACPEIGHGDLFKKVFRFLIIEAIDLGLYKKVDYNETPVEYCGMILSSSII